MMMHIKPDGPVYQVKLVSVRVDLEWNLSTLADCGIPLNTVHLKPVRDVQTLASAEPIYETKPVGSSKENTGNFCRTVTTNSKLSGLNLKSQQNYLTSAARLDTDCKTISTLLGTGSRVNHIKSSAAVSNTMRSSNLESINVSELVSGKVNNVGNVHPEENFRMVRADMSLGTEPTRTEQLQKPISEVEVSDSGVDFVSSQSSRKDAVIENATCAYVVSDSHIM
jgi:hypothetical protein